MGILIAVVRELPAWMLVSLGFYVAYRVLKFPDLTADASFVTGMVGAGAAAVTWHSSLAGLALALGLGFAAGSLTGTIFVLYPKSAYKLLAGVIVLLAFYSINYRVLGYRVDLGFIAEPTEMNQLAAFEAANGMNTIRPLTLLVGVILLATFCFLFVLLFRSELGLALRALGTRPNLASASNRRPRVYLILGLACCNATVAAGGWLYASVNSYANVNVFGTIVHALAAAIIGEILVERLYRGPDRRVAVAPLIVAPLVGALAYQTLRASGAWVIVRATTRTSGGISINQQDYNTLVAVAIVLVVILVRAIAFRSWRYSIENEVDSSSG